MFIAHGSWVRKNARWLLGGILLLLIPGFIALFTTTGGREERPRGTIPTLRGKPLNAGEFEAARQAVRDQYAIAGRPLPHSAEAEDMVRRDAVTRILMLRKAREMGLQAPLELVLAAIRNQFRGENGQFHEEAYRQFIIRLNNQRISEQRFEDLMREEILIGQLQNMIADTAKVTPQEAELSYAPVHEKLTIDLVRFDAGDIKNIGEISDADAQNYYDQHKQQFSRPAQVKVRYARFGFDEVKKTVKVTESEIQDYYDRNKEQFIKLNTNTMAFVTNTLEQAKSEIRDDLAALGARRQAGERAQALYLQVVPDPNAPAPAGGAVDFAKLAGEAGAQVAETGYFAQFETPKDLKAGLVFNQAAFALAVRPEPPFSDPIAAEDGYYVLQYLDKKPARIPELAEVKTEVIARIKQERAHDAATKAGNAALEEVRKLMADGKTFAAATAAAKLKTESVGPFMIADNKLEIPGAMAVKDASLGMATNAVSRFIPTAEGGVFFHLRDRQPYDRAEFEKEKAEIVQVLLRREREAMVMAWLSSLWREEQVDLGAVSRMPALAPEPDEVLPEPAPAAAPVK